MRISTLKRIKDISQIRFGEIQNLIASALGIAFTR
jgi:hypothetical protein